MQRIGTAIENMTSNHRDIKAGSAFCWLYKAWAHGNPERGIEALPDDAVVVEVGVGCCHSLGYLLDVARPGWTIFAIDPYIGKGRFVEFMHTCVDKLVDVIDRVNFMRVPSPVAASVFGPNTVDAVLIDGDHDMMPVLNDLDAWWPVVRPGGYLAGDDVDPMFSGCEYAWEQRFPHAKLYGSTAVVRKPVM